MRAEDRQVLAGERQGCHVKTRTSGLLLVTAHGGMETAIFNLEKACPSSPGLCPPRVLVQTLAGCRPLFVMTSFPRDNYLLGIANTSHCWSPAPMPDRVQGPYTSSPLCLLGSPLALSGPCGWCRSACWSPFPTHLAVPSLR